MLEKVLLFGVGYLLGSKAGRERYAEFVDTVKKLAARDEVRMALGVTRGLVEDRLEAGLKLVA